MWKASKIKVTGIFIDNSTDSLREHTLAVPSFYQFLNTKLSIHCCSTIPPGNTELPFQPGPRHVSAPCCTGRKTHSTYRRDFSSSKRKAAETFPVLYKQHESFPVYQRHIRLHLPSGMRTRPACFLPTAGKGKPDAAHISKTKADWWSQRHALLKQTLAETPCQLLFIGDSITHRWETDGKKIWSQYFSPMLLSISG